MTKQDQKENYTKNKKSKNSALTLAHLIATVKLVQQSAFCLVGELNISPTKSFKEWRNNFWKVFS